MTISQFICSSISGDLDFLTITDSAAVNILPNYNVSSVWAGVMSASFCAVFSVSGTMPGTGQMLNKYLRNE